MRRRGFCAHVLLLLDVRTQLEDVLLAGRLELVGETEIFDLNLQTDGDGQRGGSGSVSGPAQGLNGPGSCGKLLPAGSGSLPPHTSHSSPSGVCSGPDSPSGLRCLSGYQPPPAGGHREENSELMFILFRVTTV